MEFDQFLENYEAAWDLGLQYPSLDIIQVGDLVVVPTSPVAHNSSQNEGISLHDAEEGVQESFTELERAVSSL